MTDAMDRTAPTAAGCGGALAGQVIHVLAGMVRRDAASVQADTRLFDDLGFDSTAVLELLMQLEDEFGVEFDPYEVEPRDFETVGTVVEFVGKQLAG
jgi:acyl carrier protein